MGGVWDSVTKRYMGVGGWVDKTSKKSVTYFMDDPYYKHIALHSVNHID